MNSLSTPQGEPALTQTDGLPGTRELVDVAPQGIASESPAPTLTKGDYVLATKYCDGDSGDHYCIGYFDHVYDHYGQARHIVVDNNDRPFRANGFRRCERITDAEGRWMIARFPEMDATPLWVEEGRNGEDDKICGKSIWDWLAECRASPQPQRPEPT